MVKPYNLIDKAFLAALAAACFVVPVLAAPALWPIHDGAITYISGGIGASEQNQLQSQAGNYDLAITNTNKSGHYTANNDLAINDRNGREEINVQNAGPLFYANLSPGRYMIDASHNGQHTMRHVRISGRKPTRVHLIWQQS